MVLKISFPAPTGVGLSSADNRADLAGMLVCSTAGVPRAGLFAPALSIVTARASMGVNGAAFNAALVRNGLPAWIANDGTTVVPIGSAPGANFRYDIVYVKQNESAAPFSDANNNPIFGFVSGTPSATPETTLAAAIASVPAGGLPIASVLIPSTATTTQSAGVVITPIFPHTAMAGGSVPFRTQAELLLWTTATTLQRASVFGDSTAKNGEYVWTGAAWRGVQRVTVGPNALPGAGAAHDGITPTERKAASAVGNSVSGFTTVTYPSPFPTGVGSIVVSNGDASGARQNAHFDVVSQTLSGFTVWGRIGTTGIADGSARINYVAEGW